MPSRHTPLPVILTGHHRVHLEAMEEWLARNSPTIRVVDLCTTWSAVMKVPKHPSPVILLDDEFGTHTTVPTRVTSLRGRYSEIVFLTSVDNAIDMRLARAAGVRAFANKADGMSRVPLALRAASESQDYTPSSLADVFLTRSSGAHKAVDHGLSTREQTVMALYGGGLPLKSVARRLGVQEATVRTYLKRIKSKYAIRGIVLQTKVDILRQAIVDGILEIGA